MNSIFLIILLHFAFACSQQDIKHKSSGRDSIDSSTIKEQSIEMIKQHEVNIEGYTFKYGYVKYDEEKYGFDNPGFLNVYKDKNLIYTDSFKGQGRVEIESLSHHDLDGDKFVFRLNYGTEACDYAYNSKYYFTDKKQCRFLKECYSFTGGDQYSSKFYKHIFPTDSYGQPNSILIVEGQIFHEKDQPDRFDTSYVKFANRTFNISKPTDNLSKVK